MRKSLLILALLFTFSSCKKTFFDINDNPNDPAEGSITASLILPQALHETGRIQVTDYSTVAHWIGWWTRGGDYGPNPESETYNITTNFGITDWNDWYNNLYDYEVIIRKTTGTKQYFYQAIAKTMRVTGFMYLTDTYNNVPYSKAFDIVKNITPAYDKGPDIYKNLLKDLDEALVLLSKVEPGADEKITVADIMFHGSATLWKKYINTMRLKLVLRLSQTTEINHATELQKVTTEGFLGAGETAAVNPGYTTLQGKQNPFWDNYRLTAQGEVADRVNRANNYTLNKLRTNGDIRYQYYYLPAQTPLNGNIYFGYNFGENLPNGYPYKSANSSAVAGNGLVRTASDAQWILTSVESLFLQAEAAQRNYISGNAKALFEAAVRESFAFLHVTNAATEADNFIASGNSLVNWDAAANKIQLIITQKYFSTVGLLPFEAWTDYRRTGFPADIPFTMAANPGPSIPVRFRYPQTEYNYNPINVQAEGDISPFTSRIFWDK